MIQKILLRWGLAALAPYILPGLLVLVAGGGGFTLWWMEWFTWQTFVTVSVAAGLVVFLAFQQTISSYVLIVLIVAGLYIKARFDENAVLQVEITALKEAHALKLRAIEDASEKEITRQIRINADALEKASKAKQVFDAEKEDWRQEKLRIIEEAKRDKDAERPAFSADAVDRLNRLRFQRKPRTIPTNRAKPKNRKTSLLDDAALSASLSDAEGRKIAVLGGGPMGKGREAVRGLQKAPRRSDQACIGTGCSPLREEYVWWTGFRD